MHNSTFIQPNESYAHSIEINRRQEDLLHQPENAALLSYLPGELGRLRRLNLENGYKITTLVPGTQMGEYYRAVNGVADIFQGVYQGDYPIEIMLQPDFISAQVQEGKITPFYLFKGVPEDEANMVIGGVSAIRHLSDVEWSEALQCGEPLEIELGRSAINRALLNDPNAPHVSEIMLLRAYYLLAGAYKPAQLHQLSNMGMFADCRIAVERKLSNGYTLPGGHKTTHTAIKMGLAPTVVHASYQFGSLDHAVFEPMLVHSRVFDVTAAKEYMRSMPLYLPVGDYWTGFGDFLRGLHQFSYMNSVELSVSHSTHDCERKLAVHNNGAYYDAVPGDDYSVSEVAQKMSGSPNGRTMKVRLPATPEFVGTMEQLRRVGAVPIGFKPGTQTKILDRTTGELVPYHMPHFVYFQVAQHGVLKDIPQLSLPRDYSNDLADSIGQKVEELRKI